MEEQTPIKSFIRAPERLESIISSAMDAIISVDIDQRIVLFNPAAEKMFGVSAREAIGQKIERFIPERFRPAHASQVRAFGSTGATHRRMGRLGQVWGLRADGAEFPAEASISHVDVDGGKIYTVIMRDISERLAAEEALVEARENLERLVQERTKRLKETIAELEEISYNITHDMRAPLRAIQSFAGILETEAGPALAPEYQNYIAMMKAAAARMDALIRDVLTFNSVVRQEVSLTPLDAEALLRSILATYPEFRDCTARVTIQPGIPSVLGNEALLTQCFSNLLSNGIKFARLDARPEIEVSSSRIDDWVRISFRDSGIGIPKDLQTKIFGIFQRLSTDSGGTGIGLAIVSKAMERMSGRVSLDSEPGHGSTFHLDLLPG